SSQQRQEPPPMPVPQLRDIGVVRLGYAGGVAARILLEYKTLQVRKPRMSVERYERRLRRQHLKSARRIYRATLRLQGLMIKIGQTLGSRGDLLPAEYIQVLSRLQDQVPPRPWKTMRPHIEGQLGARIGEVFAELDNKPVAAASWSASTASRLPTSIASARRASISRRSSSSSAKSTWNRCSPTATSTPTRIPATSSPFPATALPSWTSGS